ncbi:MAG TPA: hypothetical protein VMF89_35530, partial [Polyangiales bacterium]|nr:hypothetical protein [Polyangiales bacterium]
YSMTSRSLRMHARALVSRLRPAMLLCATFCGCAASATEAQQSCVEALDLQCAPAYAPSFEGIYTNLLSKSCGAPGTGNVCHSAEGLKGGLDLSDIERSYNSLLGTGGGAARVLPGDPTCSVLVARLESTDPATRMPVGSTLSVGERCVVRKWIADGAAR